MKTDELMGFVRSTSRRASEIFSRDIGIEPHSRFKIYRFLYEETDLTNLFYWISLLSSVGIATLGLAQNSPAVIIGAMLLSPLMGPIIAFGLSLAIGDLYLGLRAVINCAISIVVALLFSAFITFILPFQVETSEVLSRTRPNTLDLGVALFCGIIGAISVARMPIGGVSMALPGVAIAVALVPPLCAAGFGLGAGFKWNIFLGAFLLFLTNLVSIVFSSLVIFLLLKMGDDAEIDRIREFISERSRRNKLFSWLLEQKSLQAFKKVGKLSNRFIIIGIVLAALIIPLSTILNQIKRELIIKRETQRAISKYLPEVTLLSKEMNIGKKETYLHLVILSGPSSEESKIKSLEEYLRIKLNEKVNVSCTEVPNRAALASTGEPAGPKPVRMSFVSKEIDSKYFREIRELLPEKRRAEILRMGLAVDRGSASPVIELVFLSDDGFTVGEKGILKAAMEKSLSDKAELSVRTVPLTVAELDLTDKENNFDAGTIAERIEILKAGFDGLSAVPEIRMPEKISQLKRAKAIWRADELLGELRGLQVSVPPGEPAMVIDPGLQIPILRLRFER